MNILNFSILLSDNLLLFTVTFDKNLLNILIKILEVSVDKSRVHSTLLHEIFIEHTLGLRKRRERIYTEATFHHRAGGIGHAPFVRRKIAQQPPISLSRAPPDQPHCAMDLREASVKQRATISSSSAGGGWKTVDGGGLKGRK